MNIKDIFKNTAAAVAISVGLSAGLAVPTSNEAQAQSYFSPERQQQRFFEQQQRNFEQQRRAEQRRFEFEQFQRQQRQFGGSFGHPGFSYGQQRRRNNDAGAAAAGAAIGFIGGLLLNEALRGQQGGGVFNQGLPPPPRRAAEKQKFLMDPETFSACKEFVKGLKVSGPIRDFKNPLFIVENPAPKRPGFFGAAHKHSRLLNARSCGKILYGLAASFDSRLISRFIH